MDFEANYFPEYLSKMLLKLVNMKTVFLDRDYSDKDKLCLIPSTEEDFVVDLIARLGPLPCTNLSIYGALFPSIQEIIIKSSPHLTTLALSHLNITNEILITVCKYCEKLEVLRLQHILLWNVLSIESFCEGFFKGSSLSELKTFLKDRKLEEAKLSFPKLRELELSYGASETAVNFHVLILSFYKNVNLVYSNWKSGFFDDSFYGDFFGSVIKKSISLSGYLSIGTLITRASEFINMSEVYLKRISFNCPLVSRLKLDCTKFSSSSASVQKAASNLKFYLNLNINIKTIYIDMGGSTELSMALLRPSLLMRSSSLTELTLESGEKEKGLLVLRIKEIMDICFAIKVLRVIVWFSLSLTLPQSFARLNFPVRESLQEIWIHERGHDVRTLESSDYNSRMKLISALTKASPALTTLSISVPMELAGILDKFSSHARVLHILIHDGFEWQPSVHQFKRLIESHRELEQLYLEDVSEDTFSQLKRNYQSTMLRIFWGTLDGWPRS